MIVTLKTVIARGQDTYNYYYKLNIFDVLAGVKRYNLNDYKLSFVNDLFRPSAFTRIIVEEHLVLFSIINASQLADHIF